MSGVEDVAGIEDAQALQHIFEVERTELERSQRVHQQFLAGLETLRKRHAELEAESAKLYAETGIASVEELERKVEAARESCDAAELHASSLEEAAEQRRLGHDHVLMQLAKRKESRAELDASQAELLDRQRRAHSEHGEAMARAKSMVTVETLERANAEALQLEHGVEEQRAETSRLRQALMDSWAARDDQACPFGAVPGAAPNSTGGLDALEDVEEELKWLAKMQQEAATEVHHVQKLERSEAALQKSLQAASEEKASLQSTRVDLGDSGKAIREAIAAQSEGHVKHVNVLAEARRNTDVDRVKLINESADLQQRLQELAPELDKLAEQEDRHARLETQRQALDCESTRLRAINSALGVQLLGDAGPSPFGEEGASAAEAVTRALQLQLRLVERREAHSDEKEKLAARIRTLEREVVSGGGLVSDLTPSRSSASAPAPPAAPKKSEGGGAIKSATKALKGFGKLLR